MHLSMKQAFFFFILSVVPFALAQQGDFQVSVLDADGDPLQAESTLHLQGIPDDGKLDILNLILI